MAQPLHDELADVIDAGEELCLDEPGLSWELSFCSAGDCLPFMPGPKLDRLAQPQLAQLMTFIGARSHGCNRNIPDLARKMALSGAVKIEVTVAPNGTVKSARVVGGHPVLAGAALDAARKWRFEPAPIESSGVIEFKFEAPH